MKRYKYIRADSEGMRHNQSTSAKTKVLAKLNVVDQLMVLAKLKALPQLRYWLD
jgi:hypothetical protein